MIDCKETDIIMVDQRIIEDAIHHRRKINFRMTDTPEGSYILFHPYALIEDLIAGENSVMGLVEKHHTSTDTNYLRRPTVRGMIEVIVLQDQFEPDHSWENDFNFNTNTLILKAETSI